jgi:hypothetical protein
MSEPPNFRPPPRGPKVPLVRLATEDGNTKAAPAKKATPAPVLRYDSFDAVLRRLTEGGPGDVTTRFIANAKSLSIAERLAILRELRGESDLSTSRVQRDVHIDANPFNDSPWRFNAEYDFYNKQFWTALRPVDVFKEVLLSTPKTQRTELLKRAMNGDEDLFRSLMARVNNEPIRRIITSEMAPAIGRTLIEIDHRLALADARRVNDDMLRTKTGVRLTPEQVLDFATWRASTHIAREAFPFGGKYLGLSAQVDGGNAHISLHNIRGGRRELVTIKDFATSAAKNHPLRLVQSMVNAVRASFFGITPEQITDTTPELWACLARDLLPAAPEGAAPGLPISKLLSKNSKGEVEFGLPLVAMAKLVGMSEGAESLEPAAVQRAVLARLNTLGGGLQAHVEGGRIFVPADDAKLLLTSREYNRAFRAAIGTVFDESSADLLKTWEFVRHNQGRLEFVLPTALYGKFYGVTPGDGERMSAAVSRRLTLLGVEGLAVNDRASRVPVIAVSPEHARMLLQTTQVPFFPDTEGFTTENIGLAFRLTNIAYEGNLDAIAPLVRPLGFKKDDLAFVEMENGAETLVGLHRGGPTPYFAVSSRGTDGFQDASTDAFVGDFVEKILRGDAPDLNAALAKPTLDTFLTLNAGDRAFRFAVHKGFLVQTLTQLGISAEHMTSLGVTPDLIERVEAERDGVPGVMQEIERIAKKNNLDPKRTATWWMGHSKGGAETTLGAAILKSLGYDVRGTITIEGARAATQGLVDFYDATGLSKRSIRYVQYYDIVPHVPPWAWGFVSPGWPLIRDGRPNQPPTALSWGGNPDERFLETVETVQQHYKDAKNFEFDGMKALYQDVFGSIHSPLMSHLVINAEADFERHFFDRPIVPPLGEGPNEPPPPEDLTLDVARMLEDPSGYLKELRAKRAKRH